MADTRGLFGDSWAFTEALGDGIWDAGTGMVKGLGDLAKGGYKLATDANARESAWETTKQLADAAADYSKSVIENPGEAYRYARDGTLAAYDRFEQAKDLAAVEGRSAEFFGDMAGGALFEVGSILVPVGLVAKAGKLGKVASVADDVADAAKAAKKVENAEDVFGATQKAKAASVNPVIKEFDDKVSPIQRCPVADVDVGVKNTPNKINMRSPDGLMGVEPASNELISAVGEKRDVIIAQPGSEELRMLDYFGAEASVGGVNNTHILLREKPSKAAVLEEFLHGTQSKLEITDRLGTSGLGSAETHVKDFMIRHQKMLGLGDEDIQVLQILRDKGL